MKSQQPDTQSIGSRRTAASHRLSMTETIASDNAHYPEDLRRQIEALDKINGLENGKSLVFLDDK